MLSFFRGQASLPFSALLCSFCTDNTAFNLLRKKSDERYRRYSGHSSVPVVRLDNGRWQTAPNQLQYS